MEEKTVLVKFKEHADPVRVTVPASSKFQLPLGAVIISEELISDWVDNVLLLAIIQKERTEAEARLTRLPEIAAMTLKQVKASFRHGIGEGDRVGTIEESGAFNARYSRFLDFLSVAYGCRKKGLPDDEMKAQLTSRYRDIVPA